MRCTARPGAKMVPFAGWEMPVQYSSVQEEHLAVRNRAGLFDVSHMGLFEFSGDNVAPVPEHRRHQRRSLVKSRGTRSTPICWRLTAA